MAKNFTKDVRQHLSEAGCYFLRHGKGDHDIWVCPNVARPITVDNAIPSRHLANAIMRQAGLPKKF